MFLRSRDRFQTRSSPFSITSTIPIRSQEERERGQEEEMSGYQDIGDIPPSVMNSATVMAASSADEILLNANAASTAFIPPPVVQSQPATAMPISTTTGGGTQPLASASFVTSSSAGPGNPMFDDSYKNYHLLPDATSGSSAFLCTMSAGVDVYVHVSLLIATAFGITVGAMSDGVMGAIVGGVTFGPFIWISVAAHEFARCKLVENEASVGIGGGGGGSGGYATIGEQQQQQQQQQFPGMHMRPETRGTNASSFRMFCLMCHAGSHRSLLLHS